MFTCIFRLEMTSQEQCNVVLDGQKHNGINDNRIYRAELRNLLK